MPALRRARPLLALLGLSLGLAAAPATADAACTGRPGAGAAEQYCEAVPSADGGRDRPGSDGSQGSGSGSQGSSSGSAGAAPDPVLEAAGADGRAVSELAGESTAPRNPSAKGTTSAGASEASAAGVAPPQDPPGSALAATSNAVQDGSTAGNWLIWGLAAIAVIGIAAALLARRRSPQDPS